MSKKTSLDSQQLDFGPVWVTGGVRKAWGAKILISCIPDIMKIKFIYAKNRRSCSNAGKASRAMECSASAPVIHIQHLLSLLHLAEHILHQIFF